MPSKTDDGLILGLDLGTNSIGWSLLRQQDGHPTGIEACGVRIFEMGVNVDPKSGKNTPRSVERRMARQRRRLLDRRQMRKIKTRRILSDGAFMPRGRPATDADAWNAFLALDPYAARAAALNRVLTPLEFGRAVYHICQRRGLRDGFMRLQYSVYARYCISEDVSTVHRQRIRGALPEEGEVRVVTLTDHQFGKMEVYVGKNREPTEEKPLQLQFF